MARLKDTGLLAGHPVRPNREDPSTITDILCGHSDGYDVCDRTISWIVQDTAPHGAAARSAGAHPHEQPTPERIERYLAVPPGYALGRDDVFYETNRAAANVRHGRAPGYRRPISGVRRDSCTVVYAWWYRVRCSKCGHEHTLRADEMGLTYQHDGVETVDR
jgi:hypothetical protein